MAAIGEPAPGADVDGRARAVTVLTPLTWYGPWQLRLRFLLVRLLPRLVKISGLQAIYATRWTILTSFPAGEPGRPQARRRARHLLWDSAFCVPMEPYIELFVYAIGRQIRLLWGSSQGFPGTGSTTELRRYIDEHSIPGAYWYAARPDASVRMVLSALAVAREHPFLAALAEDGSPEDFAVAYRGFLVRRQEDL